ncbi:g9601 [Coccomyxa viridis]|uniref:G9601 protein n=1 Tax=Coccomyxa viridis TaxID=1274662 RepID=A0ABP1G9K6_9CHLO
MLDCKFMLLLSVLLYLGLAHVLAAQGETIPDEGSLAGGAPTPHFSKTNTSTDATADASTLSGGRFMAAIPLKDATLLNTEHLVEQALVTPLRSQQQSKDITYDQLEEGFPNTQKHDKGAEMHT